MDITQSILLYYYSTTINLVYVTYIHASILGLFYTRPTCNSGNGLIPVYQYRLLYIGLVMPQAYILWCKIDCVLLK
jgi:hypothetical protein